MKHLLLLIFICSYNQIAAQYIADLSRSSSYGATTVYIASTSNADLSIEISKNALYEDFTIGFTNDIDEADVIITERVEGNWRPYLSSSSYADVSIWVSESILYEDICIEIKKLGTVDYLVYNDDSDLSLERLAVALLPIINSELDEDERLEDIPFYQQPLAGSTSPYSPKSATGSTFGNVVLETQMDDEFEGWEGETVFKFYNGQVWQQVGYEYHYHYSYMPEVTIYERNGYYYMKVEDVDEAPIQVQRLK